MPSRRLGSRARLRSRARARSGAGPGPTDVPALRSPIARIVAPAAAADEDAWAIVGHETVAAAAVERLCAVVPALERPLEAERLGAQIPALWWSPAVGRRTRADLDDELADRIVEGLLAVGGCDALAALRALSLAGGDAFVRRASPAAEALRATGLDDPGWWGRIEEIRPTAAHALTNAGDPGDVMLLVQFDRVGEAPHTLLASIRATRGGTMGLIECGPGLAELEAMFFARDDEDGEDGDGSSGSVAVGEIDLAEAGAMIERAIRRTDALGTAGPVEDYVFGRGLARRRAATLRAAGGEPPAAPGGRG